MTATVAKAANPIDDRYVAALPESRATGAPKLLDLLEIAPSRFMPPKFSLPQPVEPLRVLDALEVLIASPAFGKSERPARFLRHLVETTLRDQKDHLKESVLGVEIFGRPADWDPRLDTIVRQEASRLRKRLARYYETEGSKETLEIRLPVGSYIPLFVPRPGDAELAGAESPGYQPPFPSLSPSSLPSRAARAPRYAWIALAALLLCVAAVVAATLYPRHISAKREDSQSLGVLPFTDLSPAGDSQYFARRPHRRNHRPAGPKQIVAGRRAIFGCSIQATLQAMSAKIGRKLPRSCQCSRRNRHAIGRPR